MAHTYQLAARMEGGEVSELYRGLQDRSREVVLKVFSPRLSDPEYGRALSQAARRAGELEHPSILHFEDVGVARERLCCVRPQLVGYHLGTALTRLTSKEVVLPPPVALQIGVEVMAAVGAAHQAGIVHGALTPANVFVTREGRVLVSDFMALWAMKQSPALRPLADRGRKAYRAPELAKGAEADPSADVYSVGAILYELLTLHEVASSRGGGVSTRRDELTPPSRLDRRVNARLDPLILRALEPLKSRRHKNCLEQAEAFRSFLAQQGGAPGRLEIGKFIAELFPNEVNLAGSTSELPIAGEFELEPLTDGASLPEFKLEVSERVSYSPASVEVPVEPEPRPTLDENRKPQTFSEWDAPPGELDPAVLRRLSGPAGAPIEQLETQPLSRDELSRAQRPNPAQNFVAGDSRTDVTTNPEPAKVLLGPALTGETSPGPPPPAPAPPPRAQRPRRASDPAPAPSPSPAPPKADWHVKYEPRPKPPPPRTPRSTWAVAVAMATVASLLTFLALMHRDQLSESEAPTAVAPPPVAAAAKPPPRPEPPRPPAVHRERAQPMPVALKPQKFCLTMNADVAPAAVRIDGSAAVALPLEDYPVAAGDHELVVFGHHRTRKLHVTEALTRAPCVAQTILLGRGAR